MQDEPLVPSHQSRECSILFRELLDHMNSIITLIESSTTEGSVYALVIPPNSEIEHCVTSFSMRTRGAQQRIIRRVPQSIVRRHLLHGPSLTEMSTLTGNDVHIDFLPYSSSRGELVLGYMSLLRSDRPPLRVSILQQETYNANEYFYVFFVDGSLLDSEAARITFPTLTLSGRNHLWTRLQKPIIFDESSLFRNFKNDENFLRSFLEDFFLQKSEENSDNNNNNLRKQLDDALLYVETEVGIMSLSYIFILGYEQLTIAKVIQIITAGAEAATNSSSFSEEDKEDVLVAFHTIVTGTLCRKLLTHWDFIMKVESDAFTHACQKLKESYLFKHFLPQSFQELSEINFNNGIKLVNLLESTSLSVLSFMRIMECTLNLLMELVSKYDSEENSSADTCISLLVSLLIITQPSTLPSRIRYISDFSLAVMDMSATGYALTTFEAASTQVMEEYRVHVSLE